MVSQPPVIAAMVSPIWGSKPNSAVHDGDSKTPSAEMNSCTAMVAMGGSSRSWWALVRSTNARPWIRQPPRASLCPRKRPVRVGRGAPWMAARATPRSGGDVDGDRGDAHEETGLDGVGLEHVVEHTGGDVGDLDLGAGQDRLAALDLEGLEGA